MTRLLLIRHAEAVIRVGGEPVMCGWFDPPLSFLGREQTARLAERLAGGKYAAAYASTLRRARDTARAIPPDCPPAWLLRSLRELHCGELEGVSVAEVQRLHADAWRRNEAEEDPGFRWPGGESYARLRKRVLRALQAIARRHPGGDVLVFTHAGVVSQAVGYVDGRSPAEWKRFLPRHTGITELLWDDHRPRLLAFDDCAHLTPATPRPRGG